MLVCATPTGVTASLPCKKTYRLNWKVVTIELMEAEALDT